jgi:hypothetical protein
MFERRLGCAFRIASFALVCAALSGCSDHASILGIQPANATAVTPSMAPPPPDITEVHRLIAAGGSNKEGGALRGAAPSTEKAVSEKAPLFLNGWNTLQVSYCIGTNLFGQDFLAVYMRDGTFIYTPNPIAISVLSPACVASTSVAIYVTATNGAQAIWSHALTFRN